jgi:tetratricopeptide (TPR) repeat protein
MSLWTKPFRRKGLGAPLSALLLVLNASLSAAASGDDLGTAAVEKSTSALTTGAEVVLRILGTPLRDQERQIPSDDHLIYVVERIEGDRIQVVARDKSVRGWLFSEQVVDLTIAADYFTRAVANDARDTASYWTLARVLLYQNDFERSLANLNQAIRLEPGQAELYVTRALVQLRRQQPDRAIEDCDQAIQIVPRSARTYAIRAAAWMSKNDCQRARADLEFAISIDETNPRGRIQKVALLTQQDAQAQAGERLRQSNGELKAGAEDILTPNELVKRGEDRLAMKEYDQALADLNEAIRLNPGYAPAYAARAQAWARKHYRDREIADCSLAIERDPSNANYRVARAESWSAQGMHKRAMADFADALRLEPNNPSIWVSRGNEWRRDLKLDDAIADYTHALELNPRYWPAYVARANAWKQRRLFGRAIQEFSELIRLDPQNALAHQTLARILATCNEANFRDGRRALDEATVACDLTRWRDPDCLDTLAAAYAEVGDYDAAIKWQIQAMTLIRQNVPSLLQQKAVTFGGRRGIGFEDRLVFYKSKKPTRE